MASPLGDKRVVAGLCAVACAVMYQRIVVPLLPAKPMESAFDEALDELDAGPTNDTLTQPGLKLATAQYDLRNIDVSALSFNESPSRDPFIDRPLAVAPLADVDLSGVLEPPIRINTPPAQRHPVLPKLTAIAFANDRRVAVIDNRIVRPGESLGAFEITDIARQRVTLRGRADQRLFTLTLTP